VKVAISIPDPVFRSAEQLARQLKESRSQHYSEAVAQFVAARDAKAVTRKLDEIYAKQAGALDPALQRAQLASLDDEAW